MDVDDVADLVEAMYEGPLDFGGAPRPWLLLKPQRGMHVETAVAIWSTGLETEATPSAAD